MKINITKSSMIRPVQDLPNQRLWLSNLDLFLQRNHNTSVHIFKSSESQNSFDVKVLKEALSKVLVSFYPVAGKLGRDENGRLEINCNGEGVLFIEAESDSTIDQLGGLMLNFDISQLIPTVDDSNKEISSFPLLALQVTTFKCGGLSLAIRWHHILADGSGYFHFITTWCDVARALPINLLPFIDRTILRSYIHQIPKFQHIEYDKLLFTNNSPTQNNKHQSNSTEIFKITLEQLNTLKARVENDNNETKYSSYEMLTAHIWRCTCKARSLSNDRATKLNMAVNGRSRLHPPLPSGYFGNVLFLATSIALSNELLSEPLKYTVERINKAIKRMDDEYLRSAMDYMESLDDITSIVRGPQFCQCPNLSIVSLTQLPIYDVDFGMGKPLYMKLKNPVEGKGYILQNPSHGIDRSYALIICLQTDHMQSFKKLFYD